MPKNFVVINGHPDSSSERLCHALASVYCASAQDAGATVLRIDVGQLEFPLLRMKRDFERGMEGTPASLVAARDALMSAHHIAILYPLWLGSMPALLKGFLEQTLRPGVALAEGKGKFPRALFKGKSARVIVTMGMPTLAYRWYFGAHGLRSLERDILRFAGVKPIRESLFGMVEAVSDARRKRWLDQIREAAKRDAH